MKYVISFLFFILFALSMFAAPLQNYPLEEKQPNGKVVKVLATGDEFYRNVTDEQGYTVLRDKEGYIVYAIAENGELKPTLYRVGEVNPASLGIAKRIADDPAIIKQKVKSNPSYNKERDVRNNTTGNMNNIVIFLSFDDSPGFSHDMTYYFQMFNNVNPNIPSARGFFNEESFNQLAFTSYFPTNYPSGAVRYFFYPSHPRGYYLPYSTWNDIGYTSAGMGESRWNNLIINIVNAINISHIISTTNCDTNSD
ncbi:MAG TPA: hypothetical protein PKK33_07500, partial [Candidatus Cloacimonadota bacterium]|nr:hypothetical protein [Candidatus Cloacimonadota bacterium]